MVVRHPQGHLLAVASTLQIGQREFQLPVFVPSVSSYETQLPPFSALSLQALVQEPISLASALDVSMDRDAAIEVCAKFRKTGVLLLDSGGYEAHRHLNALTYCLGNEGDTSKVDWTLQKYLEVAKIDIYDKIFSFDYFINRDEKISDFITRFCNGLSAHSEYVDMNLLIPVIHLRSRCSSRSLDESDIKSVCEAVTTKFNSTLVAVPERELGEGILNRAEMARYIADLLRLRRSNLHVLGCGNLLTFAFLAVAGVAMVDGLEWCRTVVAPDFHLHHFQHLDAFKGVEPDLSSPMFDFFSGSITLPYSARVALSNLYRIKLYTDSLHESLLCRDVSRLVREYFGSVAGDQLKILEG